MIKSTIRKFYEAITECIDRKHTFDDEVKAGIKTPVEGEASKIIAEAFFHRKADAIWAEVPQIPPQPGDEKIVKIVYGSIGIDVKIEKGGF